MYIYIYLHIYICIYEYVHTHVLCMHTHVYRPMWYLYICIHISVSGQVIRSAHCLFQRSDALEPLSTLGLNVSWSLSSRSVSLVCKESHIVKRGYTNSPQKSSTYLQKSPTHPQKSPAHLQKSPTHLQKSPTYILTRETHKGKTFVIYHKDTDVFACGIF